MSYNALKSTTTFIAQYSQRSFHTVFGMLFFFGYPNLIPPT